MGATTTTAAKAIDDVFEPSFIDEVYRYTFLGITDKSGMPVFPQSPTGGGTSVGWKVHTTGQTAEVFTEGDPTSPAGNQAYVDAQVAPTYFRVMTEWTGHLADALQDPAMFFDAIEAEIELAQLDLFNLINQTFMGATYSGILVSIDETTTYAGVSRAASPAYFSSTETDVSTTQSLASMEDTVETQNGTNKGGIPGVIIMAPNQATNYSRLPGVVGSSNNSVRVNLSSDGTPLDVGYNMDDLSFQGAPIKRVPGFSTTTVAYLDTRPGIWNLRVHRSFQSDWQGRVGDGDEYAHTTAMLLQNRRPKLHAKQINVTA